LKLFVEVDGQSFTLDLRRNGNPSEYALHGAHESSGPASVEAVAPGVYSVLLGTCSFTVNVARNGDSLEVWAAGRRYSIAIADARDRTSKTAGANASGTMEVRAQMPGKVIKVLVEAAAHVETGQGLVVVEAMKMQNEIKSPKDGVVSKIYAVEGATVSAGEVLLVVT